MATEHKLVVFPDTGGTGYNHYVDSGFLDLRNQSDCIQCEGKRFNMHITIEVSL